MDMSVLLLLFVVEADNYQQLLEAVVLRFYSTVLALVQVEVRAGLLAQCWWWESGSRAHSVALQLLDLGRLHYLV
jgi:hypothetical protein